MVAPRHEGRGAGMLGDIRDTPADTGLNAPARAGPMTRAARAVRTRWRVIFLVAGAALTPSGCSPGQRRGPHPWHPALAVRPAARNRIQRLHVRRLWAITLFT
jgi:hypothetical protein